MTGILYFTIAFIITLNENKHSSTII